MASAADRGSTSGLYQREVVQKRSSRLNRKKKGDESGKTKVNATDGSLERKAGGVLMIHLKQQHKQLDVFHRNDNDAAAHRFSVRLWSDADVSEEEEGGHT